MVTTKSIALSILSVSSFYFSNAQVIGKIFPSMDAETVEDKKVNLPGDVKGKYTLLGLAYSKKSEDELNTWFEPVFSKFVQKPSGLMAGMDSFEQQAFELITSKAKEVFDPKKEDPKTRDKYGAGLGEQLMMARRLCEAGVGFVTIHFGGWDMHGGIKTAMDTLGPKVDRAVAAFVDDCADRGIDQDVLLVITGEFGRTPRINGSAGRDHWAPLSTLALAGGGLKMGQVVGESNSKVEAPRRRRSARRI